MGAVSWDGSADYATRGAALSSIADSKLFTLSCWLHPDAVNATQIIFSGDTTLSRGIIVDIRDGPTNVLEVVGYNSGGSSVLSVNTTGNALASAWTWVGMSFDMSDTAKRFIYFNNTSVLTTANSYTNNALSFSGSTNWACGAEPTGANKYTGGMAELLFWPGQYIDLSVASNRAMFYTGRTVNSGIPIASLGAPSVYFHIDVGETANNFVANNDGGATGGAFSMTGGALSAYTSNPP